MKAERKRRIRRKTDWWAIEFIRRWTKEKADRIKQASAK